MNNNLEVINLNKKYPDFSLKNINIKLPKGKVIGFIGENGSGKTTTIKAILNLININSGNINIFGKAHNTISKEDIGVVLDDSFFPNVFTPKDINNLMKHFYKNWNEELYFKYIDEFKLPVDKKLKELSSGMKMKIKVICAICHKPKLLILDEPTNGLDPIFRYEVLNIFSEFVSNKENSIFISSHITSDLEHIADEIIFIDNGSIMLDMEKDELFNHFGIVECPIDKFDSIDKKYYKKYLKYKDMYMLLIDDREHFKKKYSLINIKNPSIEELMLLFIKGEEYGNN